MSFEIAPLIAEYGDPINVVDRAPRTASELYYRWAGLGPRPSLSRRQRRERRALARYLSYLAKERKVTKHVITETDYEQVYFWRHEVQVR